MPATLSLHPLAALIRFYLPTYLWHQIKTQNLEKP